MIKKMTLKNRTILKISIGFVLILSWILAMGLTKFTSKDHVFQLTLLGLAIGYVLQRAFFGFAGTVARTSKGNPKLAFAVILLFGIGAIAVALLASQGLFAGKGNKVLNARPIGLGVFIGSAIFGVGMILGKACASGALTDTSNGSIRVVIVIVFFIIGAGPGQMVQYSANHGSLGTKGVILGQTAVGWIGSVVLTLLFLGTAAIAAYLIAKKIRTKNNLDLNKLEIAMDETEEPYETWLKNTGFTKGGNQISQMSKKTYFNLFARKWSLWIGAVAFSVILIVYMFAKGKGWGVTTAFAKWYGWIFHTNPFLDANGNPIASKLSGGIMSDSGSWVNFSIAVGALGFTLMSGKFKFTHEWKGRNWKQVTVIYLVAALGGFFLGFGARLADGCNAGQLTTGVMTHSLSSWVFGIGMIGGASATIVISNILKKKIVLA